MKTNGQNAVVKKKPATISDLIRKLKPQIEMALPKHVTPDRLTRVFLTMIRTTPKLAQCDQASLLGSLMTSAQLGLEPNTPLGHAYVIPYGKNATFQIGYKGILELAYRSGMYKEIYAVCVHENDRFEYKLGLHRDITHEPAEGDRGEVVKYYGVYHLSNGGFDFRVWTREAIVAHGKQYSKSFSMKDSAWQTNFDQMAKKTVLIDLLKYAPKSVELSKGVSLDEHVVKAEETGEGISLDAEYEVMENDSNSFEPPQNETNEKEEEILDIM